MSPGVGEVLERLLAEYDAAEQACQAADETRAWRIARDRRTDATVALTDALRTHLRALAAQAEAGAGEVGYLREALTFYAAEDSWDRWLDRNWDASASLAMQDRGERARMAFALVQGVADVHDV